jgi:hypothetical protein
LDRRNVKNSSGHAGGAKTRRAAIALRAVGDDSSRFPREPVLAVDLAVDTAPGAKEDPR